MVKWEQDKTRKTAREAREGERYRHNYFRPVSYTHLEVYKRQISGMMGHGSIRHNNREFTAANVDVYKRQEGRRTGAGGL